MKSLRLSLPMMVMLLIASSDLWADTDPFEEFYPRLHDYWTTTENIVVEVGKSGTLARVLSFSRPRVKGATFTIRSANPAKPVTLTRGRTGELINVPDNAIIILENIIIDGGRSGGFADGGGGALVKVNTGGELIMNDGVVLRNNVSRYAGGAVFVERGAVFTMRGGEITGNLGAGRGGGVEVDGGLFAMIGGKVIGNTVTSGGTQPYGIEDGTNISVWDGGAFKMQFPDSLTLSARSVKTQPAEPIGRTSNRIYLNDHAELSGLLTVVNADGGISVMDRENAIVYEYSKDMEFIRTQRFTKVLPLLGAFTKDKAGNYYIFYGKKVEEGDVFEKNMALVKYAPDGRQVNDVWMAAKTSGHGVMIPFDAGTCRIEISGEMIAVYFAREMFKSADKLNHQASYGFILDINTFQSLSTARTLRVPYASHSFNQFILPVECGFIFADHGDGYPRAFSIEKAIRGVDNREKHSFRFEGGIGDNYTGAEMGELAETPDGYIFAGTYNQGVKTNLRKLFLLTMDKDLTAISAPIWITTPNPFREMNVTAPKLVRIDRARYLLLWAYYDLTYMAIVNDSGKIIESPKVVKDAPLNGLDVLRYNPATGFVHWAVNDNGMIRLFADPRSPKTVTRFSGSEGWQGTCNDAEPEPGPELPPSKKTILQKKLKSIGSGAPGTKKE